MIDRHQRRALASSLAVGGAQIVDHVDAGQPGEQRAIAELNRELALNPGDVLDVWSTRDRIFPIRVHSRHIVRDTLVQHRLPVKSDHVDLCRLQPLLGDEPVDEAAMPLGQLALDGGETARPVSAAGEPLGVLDRLPEACPEARRVGGGRPGAASQQRSAVGLDQGDIDAVERGAAHQPDRPHVSGASCLSHTCPRRRCGAWSAPQINRLTNGGAAAAARTR